MGGVYIYIYIHPTTWDVASLVVANGYSPYETCINNTHKRGSVDKVAEALCSRRVRV